MSSSEKSKFMASLPDKFESRVVSGERLAIGWLETRSDMEMEYYPILTQIVKVVRKIRTSYTSHSY